MHTELRVITQSMTQWYLLPAVEQQSVVPGSWLRAHQIAVEHHPPICYKTEGALRVRRLLNTAVFLHHRHLLTQPLTRNCCWLMAVLCKRAVTKQYPPGQHCLRFIKVNVAHPPCVKACTTCPSPSQTQHITSVLQSPPGHNKQFLLAVYLVFASPSMQLKKSVLCSPGGPPSTARELGGLQVTWACFTP